MNKNNQIPSFYKNSKVDDRYSLTPHLRQKEDTTENIITDRDSLSHIRIMKKFISPPISAERRVIDKWEEDGQNEFYLRFYLPKKKISHKDKNKRIDHLIIMFNGLDEILGYDLYDVLGAQFAEQGYASVLLPTPYHLNRRILNVEETEKKGKTRYYKPTDIAQGKNADLFFYNFKKSIKELAHLIGIVGKNETEDYGFYNTYFSDKTKITLFGYSLGGLRVLTSYLLLGGNHNIHSCITFNTGPDLTRAKVKTINVDEEVWNETLRILEEKVKERILNVGENKEFNDFFKWLYLGGIDEGLTNRLKLHSNNCLSIQSGGDTTVNVDSHNHISDPKHGLHRLIVAGVDHNPTEDVKWENWLIKISANIIHFIKGSDEDHYSRKGLEKEILEILQHTEYYKHLKNQCKNLDKKLAVEFIESLDFSIEDFDSICHQLKNNITDSNSDNTTIKFIELYYISKTFYPKFTELIAVIMYTKY